MRWLLALKPRKQGQTTFIFFAHSMLWSTHIGKNVVCP